LAKNLVLLGVITGAHGIRGEVKLRSFTATPRDIASYGPLQSGRGESFEIIRLKPQKDEFIAALQGITDRTRAEALKGTELFIARERLPATREDEIYHHDLIGMAVQRPDGVALGKVVGLENHGAGDLLDVALAASTGTVLIPFARPFARVDGDRIIADLPDDYFDPE
jgi:16S rRNA processing protein RimM